MTAEMLKEFAEQSQAMALRRFEMLGLKPGEGSQLSPQAHAYQEGHADAVQLLWQIVMRDTTVPATNYPKASA